MWPPTKSCAEDQKLERCVRIMPHLDDTGGFFIVAIDKVAEMPGDELGITLTCDVQNKEAKNNRDGGRDGGSDWNTSNRVAPVLPVDSNDIVRSMQAQYGLDCAKSGIENGLMTRSLGVEDVENPKRIYYLSPGARALCMGNSNSGGPNNSGGLQIVAAGVKAFERQTAPGATVSYNPLTLPTTRED